MAESVERLLIRIDATTEQLRRELKRADKAVLDSNNAMQAALASMGNAWKSADRWVQRHSNEIKLLGTAAVGGVALATKAIVGYSDEYRQLQGQLKLVTGSQDELNEVWGRALTLSNSTGASLDSTVNLYSRMARSTEQLGLSQNDLFEITQLVNQSFVVSGASATEADSAILQLSQGLAAGALRGEELNSVMENSPRLANALAAGLGVTIGQLREMGKQGELTTQAVVTALQSQADAINTEFQAMPMTVARATNEMKNLMADAFGRADVDPLIDAIGELSEVVTDPRTVQGLSKIAAVILEVSASTVSAAANLGNFVEFLSESLAKFFGAIAADDLPAMADRIHELAVEIEYLEETGRTADGSRYTRLKKEHDMLKLSYDLQLELIAQKQKAVKETDKQTKATEEATDATKDANKAQEEHSDAVTRSVKVVREQSDAQDEQAKRAEKVLDALQFEISQLKLDTKEQFINAEIRKAGADATDEQIAAIRKHADELFTLRNANEKVTEDITKQWGDARETLSDFFFEFAKDGNNAFDTLYEGFKSTITKMVAEAAANEIFLQIGNAANGAGFSSIGSAALGQVDGQTLTGLLSGLFGGEPGVGEAGSTQAGPPVSRAGSGDVATGASAQSAQGGLGGVSAASLGWAALAVGIFRTLDDLQSGMYGLGDVATANNLNIKYGKQFGPLGDFLFPQGKDIESFGFAAAGDPISAYAINKYTDSGTAGLINNITGFKDGGNNSALGFFDFMEKQFSAEGVGKNFSEKNLQMVEDLLKPLQAFADVVGGSEFSGQFRAGNRVGLKVNGQKFKETGDFLNYMFDEIAKGATDLEPVLQNLILGFEGTAEQVLQFTGAIVSIHDQSQINSVTQAIEDFAAATPTALQSYRDQTATLTTLIANFDGSAAAAQELAETLAQNKAAAYEYVISLQQVAEQMGLVTKAQADYFRESALSEDELFRKRVNERDFFRAILDEVTDPENAQQAFQKVADLNRQIFDMLERGADGALTATQQSLLGIQDGSATGTADVFATYIEDANAALQGIIGETIGELQGTQEDMNVRIANLLENSAQMMQRASDTALEASQNMITAAQIMQGVADRFEDAAEVIF